MDKKTMKRVGLNVLYGVLIGTGAQTNVNLTALYTPDATMFAGTYIGGIKWKKYLYSCYL